MAADRDTPVSPEEAAALFHDLEDFPALLLAVSGGPDSTALMWLVARWRAGIERGPKLIAVTVDHGLRPEAADEARAVAGLARTLRITHRTLRWTGRKPATGLQEAARQARYRLLAEAARKAATSAILTAHTLDDQAETVLIRLARGSGLTGLAGMSRIALLPLHQRAPSPFGGQGCGEGYSSLYATLRASEVAPRSDRVRKRRSDAAASCLLIRPLLSVPKSRLIATLQAENIAFSEDPSNGDPRFTRARLRRLMPKLAEEGLDTRRLAVLAGRLARAEEAVRESADAAYEMLGKRTGPRIDFDAAEALNFLSDELGLRLLGRAIADVGDEGPVELGKLEALHLAVLGAFRTGTSLRRSLAGAVVTLKWPSLTVERAPPRRSRSLTTAGRAPRRQRKKR